MYSHIKHRWWRIVVVAVAISAFTTLGFSLDPGNPSLHVDLTRYGGVSYKYGYVIDHAVRIMPGGTIWAAFPSRSMDRLVRRKGPGAPGWTFLHLSPVGQVISKCTLHAPPESNLRFFPRREGGFTISTDTSVISLNTDCRPIAQIDRPGGTGVYGSANHEIIALMMEGRPIRILSSENLREVASLPLPRGVANYNISLWNSLIVIRDTPQGKCYWASLSSPEAAGQPWHVLASQDPSMVRTFGDHSIIAWNWGAPSPSLFVDGIDGTIIRSFPLGPHMRPDTTLFPETSCLSPASERAGIFLYDRHRNWIGQNKITGEHVSVIDLREGRILLSLPVKEYDPLLNCSLSKDGRVFAIMRGLNLSVFRLPR